MTALIAGRLRRYGSRSSSRRRPWGITALIAGRLRRDGYRAYSALGVWGITSGWSRFDRVVLVEQTPVGRSFRSVDRLVMLGEQTPVGRGYRSRERWVTD